MTCVRHLLQKDKEPFRLLTSVFGIGQYLVTVAASFGSRSWSIERLLDLQIVLKGSQASIQSERAKSINKQRHLADRGRPNWKSRRYNSSPERENCCSL